MIGSLKGTALAHSTGAVVLNVNGVGYRVAVTTSTVEQCALGSPAFLWTHLVVREDALELFGFLTREELEFFELLIGVSGIGPKSALGIVGLGHVDKVKNAIAAQDIGYLTTVSGIGKKSAEKIVLELKDKLAHLAEIHQPFAHEGDEEVLEALKTLGYSLPEARTALSRVSDEAHTVSERIREALKSLNSK